MQAFEYVAAKSISEAIDLLSEKGDQARVLSGGTDLIVQVREKRRSLELMVDVKQIPEVNEISYNSTDGLVLGASTPCYKIYHNPDIKSAYPSLIDAVSIIGGIQVQGRASVGGNLCNASPAADSTPALIVLDASCVIAGPSGTREVAAKDFCTAPGQTAMGNGEFLTSIKIPIPEKESSSFYLRFIPRNEMDIAVVGAGASVVLDKNHKSFVSAHVALGAVAPTPLYAEEASNLLSGQEISDEIINQAAEAAQAIARPISDMRGTANQRKHLVGVLTRRALNGAVNRVKETK